MSRVFIIGAGLIGIGGALYWRYLVDQNSAAADDAQPADIANQPEPSFLDDTLSQISNLTISVSDVVGDSQVQAFLALIRTGEGTTGPNGYRTMFGGGLFTGYADHPRQSITRGGLTSTAAGAYQFLSRTWDEMAAKYALSDFSPSSQDIAAVGLIKRRGALSDVLAGRFRAAIDKCNLEWASLPGSPYGQPTLTYNRAQAVLLAAGASILGSVA